MTPMRRYASPGTCASPDLRRELHRGVGRRARAHEVAARDPHLDDVHLDLHAQRDVAKVAHELDRLAIGELRLVPPLGVGVHHAEVVERDAHVALQAHRAIVGEARLVELQRAREVAANVRDDAEVLRGDRGELGVAGADGAFARVVVELDRFVELALLPAKHAEHVDRVADGDVVAPRFGGRDRGGHAVFGRRVIRVGEVTAGDPAEDRRRGRQLVAGRRAMRSASS